MLQKILFFFAVITITTQPITALADYADDWWNYDYSSYEEAYEDGFRAGYLEGLSEAEDHYEIEVGELEEKNIEISEKLKTSSREVIVLAIFNVLLLSALGGMYYWFANRFY